MTSGPQNGLWLLDRLVPHSTSSRICRGYRITGGVDVEALRTAWLAVVARHEILRTTLVEVDGRPVQEIAAESATSFTFVDFSHLPAPERQAKADRLVVEVDLAAGPAARLAVVRLTPVDHRAVLVLHRAVADDRSISILVGELSAGYGEAADPLASTPDLPVQYADYAQWQRGRQATPAFRQLLDWWTTALTPPPPPLVLPVDRDRPARPAAARGRLRFDWGPEAGARLTGLCRAEATTPLAVLLAAFQALLCRYGSADEVAVGVPVAVRPPEFAGLIGPFENLLVLRGDLAGPPTFRELVGRSDRALRAALAHRELPFDRLVRALGIDRDPGRIPLCDAMLIVRDEPEAELRLAGAEVRRYDVAAGSAGAGNPGPAPDLTLTVEPLTVEPLTVEPLTVEPLTVEAAEPSVAGELEYSGDLFEPASAAGVLDQLRTLLVAGLTTPDTPVDELPLDGPEPTGAADVVAGTANAADAGQPVHELVRRQAPDKDAVVWAGGTVSYGRLEQQAALIARYLSRLGVDGSAVAIRMSHGPRQLAASLGALRAGAHLVWFGTGDAGERGRAVLAELRPACLLLAGDPDDDELARWYRDQLGGRVVDLSPLDRDATAAPARNAAARNAADTRGGLDRPAYVAYTSGSTGKPKGIAQTHGAFAQFITWMAKALDLRPGSRVAQWVAPEHDPSLCEVFATLVAGGTLCPVPERIRMHPEKFVAWLAEQRITFLQTVPSFARELLKVITAEQLGSLERLVLMGEALPGELANGLRAALPHVRLTNMYGPTETIAATWCEITDDVHGTVPIGRAIPERQVLVLDEADRPCPVGVTGEIVIRSPHVAPGYVGDPAGGAAFRPVRWLGDGVRCYRTGDLARRRWDGLLEFRGRQDLQVKLLGNRIELAEVEAALAEHESVAECAVVPLTDRDGLVVQLVAYVVPRRGRSGRATGAWRAHLRRRFGASMLAVSFETLGDRLPRNVAGKVDRRRLPPPRAAGPAPTRMPRTWVELTVADIWSELLGRWQLGADESFFAVGGHSLLVAQLADRMRKTFGVQIPVWELFTNSTVAGMAALVVAAGVWNETAA